MADNVAITAGSGTTIAADDIGAGVLVQRVKSCLGADGTAVDPSAGSGVNGTGVQRVCLATDSAGVVNAFTASASFTPAASSHTGGSAGVIGDCVGAAAQFSFSPAPVSGSVVMITDAEFEVDNTAAPASAFRIYLYNVTPPSAIADDSPLTFDSGDRASFLGYIDLGTPVDHGNTCWVETHGINKMIKLSGTTVFGYLVNLTTASLVASAHVIKLYGTPV